MLSFIQSYRDEHYCTPTIREIGTHFGIKSPNGVMCHLLALRKKGHIVWQPGKFRTIRILEQASAGKEASSEPEAGKEPEGVGADAI